ncbi:MAG: hypothetical protein K2H46_03850 [Muribaculaceae bacterium]|nr:hypothetical protein [Muribaculaceae bacterium]
MTNEQNFKVGDKVRSKVAIFAIPAGISGVVVAIAHDGRYKVRLDGEKEWHGWYAGKDLELIESFDRKTAFLRELQALLRKYDARIEPYFSVGAGISSIDLYLGNDCVESWDRSVNADNIMDFDKE